LPVVVLRVMVCGLGFQVTRRGNREVNEEALPAWLTGNRRSSLVI
jgi:hypothetical protein